jgi:hypothetical protein
MGNHLTGNGRQRGEKFGPTYAVRFTQLAAAEKTYRKQHEQ